MKYMYKIQFCYILVRYVLRIEREICVFFFRGDFNGTPPQRRSHPHTHTHTHTHTHDGPTVDARSSGSRFFGFLQF